MRRLADPSYMKFPFQITEQGAASSRRTEHVREQIEQVLYTDPGERVFRPQFGAGVRGLLFEPNGGVLKEVARRRLISSLTETLQGEVDPQTLEIDVEQSDSKLYLHIRYQLATIGVTEALTLEVKGQGNG